jgi:DNA-binding CsgD family transcriptional regulator
MLLANAALESALALEPAERVADLARRALAGGRLLEQVGPAEPPFTFAAMTLMLADRLQEADSVLASGLDWAREHGDAFGYAVVSCFKAHVAYRLGDIPESEALVRRGLELAEENGWTLGLISMRGFLVDAAIERGELDGAERALAEVGAEHEIPDSAAALNLLLESRGRLRLAQGRIDEAIADLLTCGERQERWRSTNPATATWRSSAALGLAQTGRRSEALELAEDELALARRFGAPRGIGRALRVLGVVRGGDDGIADAKEAVDVLSRSEARLEHAAALADLGSLLRASGRRKAARQPLRDALDGATRCGATALAARARDELLAAGGRPRRAYVTGVEALTPSERRIARMAADGLSNREIAQALFLTVRTVESHLGNAYTKLGIAARTELADALVDRPAAVTDAA